ncbi:glycosyltransferase family 2 protein [Leeuwenhoekiella aestuarii]|uniref:GT2 family glycosyltransferase n=1 Tax=Leeuwenhoekiella aestuarii TaxID=2249426 RepID=A0A4V1KNV7_9FLAO|nr:glycosyltransferase family 2 protein [Leeuwenhoekiella aestuarii]RXG12329.1 GT2 family glycosyltransferase [Leeuwenhoekiella aestuarii]
MKTKISFSILITTFNRIEALKVTLRSINHLIERENVECIINVDGSTDGTYEYLISSNYQLNLIHTHRRQGLIASRNKLMKQAKGEFVIVLDDDVSLINCNLEEIKEYFYLNNKVAVLAARIFWGRQTYQYPQSTKEEVCRVQGFVGCAHIVRLSSWNKVPDYPEWYEFYGEEDFASLHFFKRNLEIHYYPYFFVNHRVDVKSRKGHRDYGIRLRRSLRSGWYNYFLFLPFSKILRRLIYTVFIQLRTKVFKGDFKAGVAVFLALLDLLRNLPKLIYKRDGLSITEFNNYIKIDSTKIYWSSK